MVRQHQQLNAHEFEPTPGDSEGQGSRACCSPMVTKSQTRLSNTATTGVKKGGKNPDLYAHIYSFIKYVLVVM